ncbi:MAG TPA: hypothetical protein VNW90_25230 [Acetobacteraceae bacterium]|jgi:hypothetical protein|nr:hypothetical protein [Acetobacteraceae bacterium]
MKNWDRNEYVKQCNLLGSALRQLADVHNQWAEECRERYGEGPEEVLLTGYEE